MDSRTGGTLESTRGGTARDTARASRDGPPRSGTAPPVYKEGHDTLGRIITNIDAVLHFFVLKHVLNFI